ncbi:helix-turn-helix domain-containing protein [uncultured Ornithinimicrobium sp.]|uniref:helix-turn-helix domain-containing protein n=1 Tax=uncultured Ornithinimicrobium sp. TaxID=259307 RepID=UPI00338D831A
MRITAADAPAGWSDQGLRAGVGPSVSADDLPRAGYLARLALRLTAEDSEADPGPRIVLADQAGGLLELAACVGPETVKNPDVAALEDALQGAPWLVATLWGFVGEPSVRAAATRLRVHHSTLQERLVLAERMLGWDLRSSHGRLRVQLAIVLRRLHSVPLVLQ